VRTTGAHVWCLGEGLRGSSYQRIGGLSRSRESRFAIRRLRLRDRRRLRIGRDTGVNAEHDSPARRPQDPERVEDA
jgi:hypothetical protein